MKRQKRSQDSRSKILQIIPAQYAWADYFYKQGFQGRKPIVAWALMASGKVRGLVEGSGALDFADSLKEFQIEYRFYPPVTEQAKADLEDLQKLAEQKRLERYRQNQLAKTTDGKQSN